MSVKLVERVAWAIATIKEDRDLDKGITDVDLAKILGTNKDTLAGYRQMKGLPKGKVLERLVSHYGFSPQWLFKGQGEPFPGARAKYPEVCGPDISEFVTVPAQPDFPADEFVFIRQVNGKISAGRGLVPDESVDVRCAFRREWIKKKGGNPEKMSLICVDGDSMAPTLLPGDLVLVDHNRNFISPQGGIYAITVDQEIMVKRVQPVFSQGRLRIISDNRRYDAFEIPSDQIRVNGKVIWFAREIER